MSRNKVIAGMRSALRWALLGFIVFLLWPAAWGGFFQITIVSGTSMLPTYENGDIIVSIKEQSYEIGDIVVYSPPGIDCSRCNVVHRIIEINDEGYFKTQGDNNDFEDGWFVDPSDAYGKIVLHIPVPDWMIFIRSIYFWSFIFALFGLYFSYSWYKYRVSQLEEKKEE